jgi:molybdopterin converting factor small subunit
VIIVKFFAALKEKLVYDILIEKEQMSVSDLKTYLINKDASIASLLERSRFVVNNIFVGNDFIFKTNDTIYVVPPSSGG